VRRRLSADGVQVEELAILLFMCLVLASTIGTHFATKRQLGEHPRERSVVERAREMVR
jgi:hypothetical protein